MTEGNLTSAMKGQRRRLSPVYFCPFPHFPPLTFHQGYNMIWSERVQLENSRKIQILKNQPRSQQCLSSIQLTAGMQVERGLRRAPYPGHHPAIEAGQLGIVVRDLLHHSAVEYREGQTELSSGVGNTTPTLRGSSTLNWESKPQHKPVQMGAGAVTQEQIFITTRTPAMPGPAAFLGHSLYYSAQIHLINHHCPH